MNIALIDPLQLHEQLPEVIDPLQLEQVAGVVICAFNRRGNLLAGGSSDGAVCVWDFETRGVARRWTEHRARITALSWTRSSRRLLSASLDGVLFLTDVLLGTPTHTVDLAVELSHAALHPRRRTLCLACTAGAPGAPAGVYLQHLEPASRQLLVAADESADDGAKGEGVKEGSKRGASASACFDATGEHVLVGTARGAITLVSLAGQTLATMQAGTSAVKSISLARSGRHFLLNSADRVVRAYPIGRLTDESASGRSFQDLVNRVQWSHAAYSSDSEHVIGAVSSGTEQTLYVWDLSHGHLSKMLTGPKDGAVHFVCHPTRPILAVCTRSGAVYVWTKQYTENWSAFAPDFKELEENEEYEEREDEFDIVPVDVQGAAQARDELIDIVSVEPTELTHMADADDDDAEMLFVPTRPDPDAPEPGADGDARMDVDSAKARKRKALTGEAPAKPPGKRA